MKVAFRTDASWVIGTGHVMRCMTLADELRDRGAEVRFICREHPGHLVSLLREAGYPAAGLPVPVNSIAAVRANSEDYASWLGLEQSEDAQQTLEALDDFKPDWMVVDHYGLDATWERLLRPKVRRVLVIDDLANRPHECDLLLDQNLYAEMESRYTGLLPHHARQLLGPRFALLRPEFRDARATLRKRDGAVRRILVCFGGADAGNVTGKALEAIYRLKRPEIAIDVVVGVSNPNLAEVRLLCDRHPKACLHVQTTNMAKLIVAADLAIGACGAMTWERCYLGLPAIVLVLVHNQRQAALDLAETGIVVHLGDAEHVSVEELSDAVGHLIENRKKCLTLSRRSLEIMPTTENSLVDLLMC